MADRRRRVLVKAITVGEHGGAEKLVWGDVPDPEPGPGEILVEVAAAGVNYIDTYHRKGLYPVPLPYVLGLEGAGTVIAVGPGVDRWTAGDRVAWAAAPGSYAERVAMGAEQAVRVPEGVPLDQAAAVILQGMTAHYLSRDTYPLQAGDVCLIHAGAGGVGLLLIQMARDIGATVITTVSTAEKAELAAAAGADHVIRYTEVDFVTAAREIAGERGIDVLYDSVGRDTFLPGLDLLRRRGLAVLFGQSSGPVEPLDLQILNQKGSLYVTRPTLFHYVATRPELERRAADVFEAVGAGRLQVRIGQRWPLAEAAAAHVALESRATTGKALLEA